MQTNVFSASSFGLIIAVTVMFNSDRAFAQQPYTACYINVKGDCHGWVPQNIWFFDNYNGSATNPGACVERAQQYLQWCGLQSPGGDQVIAAFNAGNSTALARLVKLDFQFEGFGPTVLNYGFDWIPIGPVRPQNIWITHSRINPLALPLGDKKIVYTAPVKGNVFACDPMMFNQANGVDNILTRGPWVNAASGTVNITQKPSIAGAKYFSNARFSIAVTDTQRVITSNGLPVGVPTGTFPVSSRDPVYRWDSNPNGIQAQNISYSIPRYPTITSGAATGTGSSAACLYKYVGITLDGVPLQAAPGDTGLDEISITMQDSCGGLSQPGGLYHRHFLSQCTPHIRESAALVGYALDGFGIYSPYDANGVEYTSNDLDECHGITSPVQWEGKLVNMYHYVMTRDYPYTVSCFKGRPTRNAFPLLPGQPPEKK